MSKRTRGAQRNVARRHGSRPAAPQRTRPAASSAAAGTADRSGPPALRLDAVPELVPPAAAESTSPVARATDRSATLVTRTTHSRSRVKPGSILAGRAAEEYVYVSQDLRRIVLVGAALFALMIGLWLILVVGRLAPLY